MLGQSPDEWPHLLLFVGDQVYADDSSPQVREKVLDVPLAYPEDREAVRARAAR